MNEESCHLSTSWHRATGDKCCHTLLCFGSSVSIRLAFIFFQCFVFLSLPHTLKGSKSKGHLILLITFTDNLHRKEINTFLRSYSGNKSGVSSCQSWVWRVQGAVAQAPAPAVLGYRVWLYPHQHKWVSHRQSVFQATCLQHFSNQSVLPPGKSASVWFIFFFNSLFVGPHIQAV